MRVDAASIKSNSYDRSYDSDFTQSSLQLIVKSKMESQGNRSLSPEKLLRKEHPSVSQKQLQRKRSCSPKKQPQKEILNPKKEVPKKDRLSLTGRSIQTVAVSRKSLGSQKLTRNTISRIHSVKGRRSSPEGIFYFYVYRKANLFQFLVTSWVAILIQVVLVQSVFNRGCYFLLINVLSILCNLFWHLNITFQFILCIIGPHVAPVCIISISMSC